MNAADHETARARHGFARLLWLALGLFAFHGAAALPAPEWTGRALSIGSGQPLAAPPRAVFESRTIDRVTIDVDDDLPPPGQLLARAEPPQTGLVTLATRLTVPGGRLHPPFHARAPPACVGSA